MGHFAYVLSVVGRYSSDWKKLKFLQCPLGRGSLFLGLEEIEISSMSSQSRPTSLWDLRPQQLPAGPEIPSAPLLGAEGHCEDIRKMRHFPQSEE